LEYSLQGAGEKEHNGGTEYDPAMKVSAARLSPRIKEIYKNSPDDQFEHFIDSAEITRGLGPYTEEREHV